jgi:hypothetical protein
VSHSDSSTRESGLVRISQPLTGELRRLAAIAPEPYRSRLNALLARLEGRPVALEEAA